MWKENNPYPGFFKLRVHLNKCIFTHLYLVKADLKTSVICKRGGTAGHTGGCV